MKLLTLNFKSSLELGSMLAAVDINASQSAYSNDRSSLRSSERNALKAFGVAWLAVFVIR